MVVTGGVLTMLFGLGARSSSASPTTAAVPKQVCQAIAAVLSDGPDPGADPVGYAEAQILPLREIHTSDKLLRVAIERLASAYQTFYGANGVGKSAQRAVAAASKTVEGYCPGVTS